jgi:tetratricopeptide (TPR) repeat protein
MERSQIKPAVDTKGRLMTTLLNYMPGAWFTPTNTDLIVVYRQRYQMALEDGKYDIAMIFLNKILEVDPVNVEAKLLKGDLYHRHIKDYQRAVEQYNKVIRLTSNKPEEPTHHRARNSLAEIIEMLS